MSLENNGQIRRKLADDFWFPKLLENNISLEDKQKIRGLLNKSWNPDIRQALNTSYSH